MHSTFYWADIKKMSWTPAITAPTMSMDTHMWVYTCTFSTCMYRCFSVCTCAPKGVECVEPGIKAAAYSAQIESTGRLLREGREATRSGRGQSAVNFSSDRKRAERKKKTSPFTEEWLALLSAEVVLRSLNDKDATDRLKADDHIKRASQGEPCPR